MQSNEKLGKELQDALKVVLRAARTCRVLDETEEFLRLVGQGYPDAQLVMLGEQAAQIIERLHDRFHDVFDETHKGSITAIKLTPELKEKLNTIGEVEVGDDLGEVSSDIVENFIESCLGGMKPGQA